MNSNIWQKETKIWTCRWYDEVCVLVWGLCVGVRFVYGCEVCVRVWVLVCMDLGTNWSSVVEWGCWCPQVCKWIQKYLLSPSVMNMNHILNQTVCHSHSMSKVLFKDNSVQCATGFCLAVCLCVTGQGGYTTVFGSGTKLTVYTSK